MYEFKFIPQQKVLDWKSVMIFKDLKNASWIHMGICRICSGIFYSVFSTLPWTEFREFDWSGIRRNRMELIPGRNKMTARHRP